MRINHWAVLAAALGYWVLGALWYSPLLFAGRFVGLMRWTPEQVAALQSAGAGREVVFALLGSVLLAYVLAHFIRYTGAETASGGVKTALWLWLGFVATTNLETVLFEGRPVGLYLINNGYHLVGILSMGALLAVWKRREARSLAFQH